MAMTQDNQDDVLPYFYIKGRSIFQRPVRCKDKLAAGFRVCTVADGIDIQAVCIIMNKGEPATEA